MHRLTTLAGVLLMMALFHRLTEGGALEARATLALGFLLIAAVLGGGIAARLGLPRLTGFLVTGLAVGPTWLGLLRPDEVQALSFVSDGAVALIGLAAGGEMRLDDLRAGRRAIARLAAGGMVVPALFVTAVLLTVTPWFPLTATQPFADRLVIVLVIGLLAAAFSPAVTIAVMSETGAHGPFARGILTVTVLGDVTLSIALSVLLAVAEPLTSAGAIHLGAVWGAFAALAGSVAAGVVVGLTIAAFLRRIERDNALFLVGLAFVLAALARLLHLELIVTAIAAGFYLENFSRVEGDRLLGALERGAAPVFVLFFALAGARLHLDALAELWPWVLLVIGLRAHGLRAGTWWAGRDPSVTPALARYGWLGLISQAGLALGLATVARRAFPAWGVSLETLVVAMIGVHELVGPVLFRRALRLVGETRETGDAASGSLAAEPAVAVAGRGGV